MEERSQTKIYECARSTSVYSPNNYTWTNNFSEGIDLRRGDQVRILGSFIEEVNSLENIKLSEPLKANIYYQPYITALTFGNTENLAQKESDFQSTLGTIGGPAYTTDSLGTEPPVGVRAPTLNELGFDELVSNPGSASGSDDTNTNPYSFNNRYELGNFFQATQSVGAFHGGTVDYHQAVWGNEKADPSIGQDETNILFNNLTPAQTKDFLPFSWREGYLPAKRGSTSIGGFSQNLSYSPAGGNTAFQSQPPGMTTESTVPPKLTPEGTQQKSLPNGASVGTIQDSWQGRFNSYFGDPSCSRLVGSEFHNAGSGMNTIINQIFNDGSSSGDDPFVATGGGAFIAYGNWGSSRNSCPFVSLEDEANVVGGNILTNGRGGNSRFQVYKDEGIRQGILTTNSNGYDNNNSYYGDTSWGLKRDPVGGGANGDKNNTYFQPNINSKDPLKGVLQSHGGIERTETYTSVTALSSTGVVAFSAAAPLFSNPRQKVLPEKETTMDNFNKMSIENQFVISTMCKLVILPMTSGIRIPSGTSRPSPMLAADYTEYLTVGAQLGETEPYYMTSVNAGDYMTTYLISNKAGFYSSVDPQTPLQEEGWRMGLINWKWGPQSVVGKILAVSPQYNEDISYYNEKSGTKKNMALWRCYVSDWMTPASYKKANPRVDSVSVLPYGADPHLTPAPTPTQVSVIPFRHGGADLPTGYNNSALYNHTNGFPVQDTTQSDYHTCGYNVEDANLNRQPLHSNANFYKGTPTESEQFNNKTKGVSQPVDNGVNFLWSSKGCPTNYNVGISDPNVDDNADAHTPKHMGSFPTGDPFRSYNPVPAGPIAPGYSTLPLNLIGRQPINLNKLYHSQLPYIHSKVCPMKPQFYNSRFFNSSTQLESQFGTDYWEIDEWSLDPADSTPLGVDENHHYNFGAIVILTEKELEDDTKIDQRGSQNLFPPRCDQVYPTFSTQEVASEYNTRNFTNMLTDENKDKNSGLMYTNVGEKAVADWRLLVLDKQAPTPPYRVSYVKDRNWNSSINETDSTLIIPILGNPPMYKWTFNTPTPNAVPRYIQNESPMALAQISKQYYPKGPGSTVPVANPAYDLSNNVWQGAPGTSDYIAHYFPTHYNQSNCSIHFQSPMSGKSLKESSTEGVGLNVLKEDLYKSDLLLTQLSIAEVIVPVGNYNPATLTEEINKQFHYSNKDYKRKVGGVSNVGTGGVKNTPGTRNNIINGNYCQSYVPDLSYGFIPLTEEYITENDWDPSLHAATTTDVTNKLDTITWLWKNAVDNGSRPSLPDDPFPPTYSTFQQRLWLGDEEGPPILYGFTIDPVSATLKGKVYSVPVRTTQEMNLNSQQLTLFRLKGAGLSNSAYPTKSFPTDYDVGIIGTDSDKGPDPYQSGCRNAGAPNPAQANLVQAFFNDYPLPQLGGGYYPENTDFSYDYSDCRRHGNLDILSIHGGTSPLGLDITDSAPSPAAPSSSCNPSIFPYYSRTNMNKLQYGGAAKCFIGANNPTIVIDNDLQRNYFENLYVPFRPNTSDNPNDPNNTTFGTGDAVPSVIIDVAGSGETIDQHGGVNIYDLTAPAFRNTNYSYNPVSGMKTNLDIDSDLKIIGNGEILWKSMGFTTDQIEKFRNNIPLPETVMPYMFLNKEVEFGERPIKNEALVDTADNSSNPFRSNLSLVAPNPQYIVQADSDRVLALNNPSLSSNPYYLVGTSLPIDNFNGNITGAKLPVSGICARNFERQGFVFDVGASSITNVVKEDVVLTSITTSILDSNFQISSNSIGESSSVIYEISRSNVDKSITQAQAQVFEQERVASLVEPDPDFINFGSNPEFNYRYGMYGPSPPVGVNLAEYYNQPISEVLPTIAESNYENENDYSSDSDY